MSQTTLIRFKRKSSTFYEAIADQLLTDMRHLETRMQADRMEIDRLREDTRLLRQESAQIEATTQAALARLKATFV